MTYQVAAIETRYNGTLFRSRLEARWAAFFDLVEWRWTYEPVDFNGWVPDFVISGAKPIFAEVKPFCDPKETLVGETQREIERAYQGPNEILLLGAAPGWNSSWLDTPALGLLAELVPTGPVSGDVFPIWPEGTWEYWWEPALYQSRSRDFFHESGHYGHRISGVHDGNGHLEVGGTDQFQSLWREAGNRVQWRPR